MQAVVYPHLDILTANSNSQVVDFKMKEMWVLQFYPQAVEDPSTASLLMTAQFLLKINSVPLHIPKDAVQMQSQPWISFSCFPAGEQKQWAPPLLGKSKMNELADCHRSLVVVGKYTISDRIQITTCSVLTFRQMFITEDSCTNLLTDMEKVQWKPPW